MESSVEVPQKIKKNCHMTQQSHWVFIQRKQKHSFEKISAPPHVCCNIIYNTWQGNNLNGHWWMNWLRRCGVYIHIYHLVIKRMKFCHLWPMDGPWGYYAEWNKSDRRINTHDKYLQVESFFKNTPKPNSGIERTDWWLPEAVGERWVKWVKGGKMGIPSCKWTGRGDGMCGMVTGGRRCLSCLEVAQRADLASSHHKKIL